MIKKHKNRPKSSKINSRNKTPLQNEEGLFNNQYPVKMSLATNLTDDSIVQKILEERRNYKQILHFNDYGKYKFSRRGLNYPETIPENKKNLAKISI